MSQRPSNFEALRFVQHLFDQYSPAAVANRLRSLRALYGWLVAEGLVVGYSSPTRPRAWCST